MDMDEDDEMMWSAVGDLPEEMWDEQTRVEEHYTASTTFSRAPFPPPPPASQSQSLLATLAQPLLALLTPSQPPPPPTPTGYTRVYPDLPSTPPRSQSMPGSFDVYRSPASVSLSSESPETPPAPAPEMREVESPASPSVRRVLVMGAGAGAGAGLARLASGLEIAPGSPSPKPRGVQRNDSTATDLSASTSSSMFSNGIGTATVTPMTSPETEGPVLPITPTPKRVRDPDPVSTSKRARTAPTSAHPPPPLPPCAALSLTPPPALQSSLSRLPYAFTYTVYRLHARGLLPWSRLTTPEARTKLAELVRAWEAPAPGGGGGARKLWQVVERVGEFVDERERWPVSRAERRAWAGLEEEERVFAAGDESQASLGRVRFSALLSLKGDAKGKKKPGEAEYELTLRPPSFALANTNRLTRAYGSRAFLTLSLDPQLQKSHSKPELWALLDDGLTLGTERFTPVFCKDGTVVCVSGRVVRARLGVAGGVKEGDWEGEDRWFAGWVDMLNPREWNGTQAMGKWAKRFELFWSASVPGPRVRLGDMLDIPDIFGSEHTRILQLDPSAPVPPSANHTDGAGYMNRAVAADAQARLGLAQRPVAIQMRLAGCKGVFLLCPAEMEDPDDPETLRVWVRPSQRKVQYGPPAAAAQHHPTHLRALETIDILQPSSLSAPSRLTTKLLVVLSENGVPHTALLKIMRDSLRELIRPFLAPPTLSAEDGLPTAQTSALALAAAIEELGSLLPGRLRRAGAILRGRAIDDGEVVEEVGVDEHPGSWDECAFGALLSGGDVARNLYLWRKVKKILEGVVKGRTGDMRIPLRESAEALIVPDPYGVLEEGEVFFQFGRPYEWEEGRWCSVFEGEVIFTRHPCMTPTDIRKVKAVDHPKLRHLSGVIVCSIKGPRSQASMSGGGDYDGDHGFVCWHPAIVGPFENVDIRMSDPPAAFEECLERGGEKVEKVAEEMVFMSAQEQRRTLQRYLLADISSDFMMQTYSRLHDKALYILGGRHPTVLDLAFKYCECLDSAKTGTTIKASVFSADQRAWDKYNHPWKGEPVDGLGNPHTERQNTMKKLKATYTPFILDIFKARGDDTLNKILGLFERQLPKPVRPEHELLAPWEEFIRSRAHPDTAIREFIEARDAIKEHVVQALQHYNKARADIAKAKEAHLPTHVVSKLSNEKRASYRAFYASGPPTPTWSRVLSRTELDTLKASFAHMLDMRRDDSSKVKGDFVYDVAFWTACGVKAREGGTGVVVLSGGGYNALRINKGFLKKMEQFGGGSEDY